MTILTLPIQQQHKLDLLNEEVKKCTKCYDLCQNRIQTVFGEGDPDADIMFIGEAPGETESKTGKVFSGPAGQLLDSILKACELRRKDVYIANIVKCRPPKNRIPSPEEAHNCSSFLQEQIAIVNPRFIVCLGSVASNKIVGLRISQARGQWFYYKHHKVLCSYHPAYLLRNPKAKPLVWEDLQMLLKEMKDEIHQEADNPKTTET